MFLLITFLTLMLHVTALSMGDYQYCYKSMVPANYLGNIIQLKFLDIETPNWTKREFQAVNCTHRGLDIVPNKVISRNVEILDLSENHIFRISSKDFFGLTSLVAIFLDDNCFKSSYQTYGLRCTTDLFIEPGAFKNLQNLRFVSLTKNYLREFPSDLPKSLSHLNIDFTHLGNITSDLQQHGSKLKALSAGLNCVQSFTLCPRDFYISSNFSVSVQYMFLGHNNWKIIPKYLMNPALETFIFSFNPVNKLFKDDFINAENLRVLKISSMFGVKSTTLTLTIENGVFDPLVNLEFLDLSLNFLKYIPNNLFRFNTKLQHLDLSVNGLSETIYNPVFLEHLYLLRYLDVSSNAGIHHRPKNSELQLGSSYANLTSLEVLMLGFYPRSASPIPRLFSKSHSDRFDRISEQSIEILLKLKNLSTISISALSLKNLNSFAWTKLRNLKSLYASFNALSFLNQSNSSHSVIHLLTGHPHEVHRIKRYSEILDEMPLTTKLLDRTNSSCSNVLDFSYNHITDLSSWFGVGWPNVCIVNLANNRIQSIKVDYFRSFTNLTVINLNHNPLHKIDPYALITLNKLRVLYLDDVDLNIAHSDLSFLTQIPNATNVWFRWKEKEDDALKTLSFWGPKNLGYFDAVVSLNLTGNKAYFATKVFQMLQSFPRIKKLILRQCGIVSSMLLLSPSIASVESSLEYLNLGENKLVELPAKQTKFLKNLRILELDHNAISKLQGNFLSRLESLFAFIVSYNQISYIESGFFSCSALKYLDLGFNDIARLDSGVLPSLVLNDLEYLDIRGNQLDCSCGVWDSFHFSIISHRAKQIRLPGYVPKCRSELENVYGGCVVCRFPLELSGISLLSFNTNSHCLITKRLVPTAAFSICFILFTFFGSVGCSKRFKRYVFRKVNEQFRVQSLKRRNHNEFLGKMFVIFDLSDNEIGDWVDDHLSSAMKNANPSIPLNIIGKDDSCGVAPSQQILRRIMTCRKTILILTNNFCFKPECQFVLSALQEIRHSKGDDHLVLIAWCGDDGAPRVPLEIQETLNRRKQCFLQFDVNTNDQVMFFETLRTALVAPVPQAYELPVVDLELQPL